MKHDAADMPYRMSVVVPVYGRWDLVARLLDELAGLPATAEVILIDDASPTEAPDAMTSSRSSVELIRLETNVGFAGAVNAGVSAAHGDVLCVVNSDVSLSSDSIECLASYAMTHVAVVGPRSLSVDGRVQPVPRRFHTVPRLLARYFVPLRLIPALDRALLDVDHGALAAKRIVAVEWVAGSCLVFPRHVWDLVGPMDERYHMHSEEMDWQMQAREAGIGVLYVPNVVVTHDEGGSSPSGDQRFLSMWRSHFLFVEKWKSTSALWVLRVGMMILYSVMAVGWKLGSCVPSFREKAKRQRRLHRAALGLAWRPEEWTGPWTAK